LRELETPQPSQRKLLFKGVYNGKKKENGPASRGKVSYAHGAGAAERPIRWKGARQTAACVPDREEGVGRPNRKEPEKTKLTAPRRRKRIRADLLEKAGNGGTFNGADHNPSSAQRLGGTDFSLNVKGIR